MTNQIMKYNKCVGRPYWQSVHWPRRTLPPGNQGVYANGTDGRSDARPLHYSFCYGCTSVWKFPIPIPQNLGQKCPIDGTQ